MAIVLRNIDQIFKSDGSEFTSGGAARACDSGQRRRSGAPAGWCAPRRDRPCARHGKDAPPVAQGARSSCT